MTAEDTRTAWQRRYDEDSALIEASPRFRSLVLAVAVAEAPARPARLRRERLPSAARWLTRGARVRSSYALQQRAEALARRIALEVQPPEVEHWSHALERDWTSRVYIQARRWANERRVPGRPR
jgi:hypothetical protein